MPEFNDPSVVDMLCQQMRVSDQPRSHNRALINGLANGVPPYSEEEAKKSNVQINVNDLTLCRESHDARAQISAVFTKPGTFFTAKTDLGPQHKRDFYGTIVSKELNRVMKRSLLFFENFRAKFAQTILHGIGPAIFRNRSAWCPQPIGIEDVMMPGDTLIQDIPANNVPYFSIYRTFKAPELIRLTRRGKVDPGWNTELVNNALEWLDEEMRTYGNTQSHWPALWSPERQQERIKSDGGCYASDSAPTINAWDFYFWTDKGKRSGWQRRMILDTWGDASQGTTRDSKKKAWTESFLYQSKRTYGDRMSELINFQFADLSAVAPFRYHSIRSLGFLLYGVCHLQNRLRCRFDEAVFEALMNYFRVKTEDDFQRAMKIQLSSFGVIEDGIEFVKPEDRYQPNAGFIQLGLQHMTERIARNAQSYTGQAHTTPDRRDITATQFMGETQKAVQLVSAGLAQAYQYQMQEYREIFRRFMIRDSDDIEVRQFQAAVLRQKVPQSMLVAECWEIEAERILGAGNKTLELAIAEKLLAMRPILDPEPQRAVTRKAILAYTDNPDEAMNLVPEEPKISDSVHDAQLASGALMSGFPVAIKTGINHPDYVEAMLVNLAIKVKQIEARDNMGTEEELMGLQNMIAHLGEHLQIMAQDESQKQRVRQYGDELGEIQNLIKGFAQRLAEKSQDQQMDPELAGKIQSAQIMAQAKAANTRESHAQRTAQRQIQFEMDQARKEQEFELEQRREDARTVADLRRESNQKPDSES